MAQELKRWTSRSANILAQEADWRSLDCIRVKTAAVCHSSGPRDAWRRDLTRCLAHRSFRCATVRPSLSWLVCFALRFSARALSMSRWLPPAGAHRSVKIPPEISSGLARQIARAGGDGTHESSFALGSFSVSLARERNRERTARVLSSRDFGFFPTQLFWHPARPSHTRRCVERVVFTSQIA